MKKILLLHGNHLVRSTASDIGDAFDLPDTDLKAMDLLRDVQYSAIVMEILSMHASETIPGPNPFYDNLRSGRFGELNAQTPLVVYSIDQSYPLECDEFLRTPASPSELRESLEGLAQKYAGEGGER